MKNFMIILHLKTKENNSKDDEIYKNELIETFNEKGFLIEDSGFPNMFFIKTNSEDISEESITFDMQKYLFLDKRNELGVLTIYVKQVNSTYPIFPGFLLDVLNSSLKRI